MSNLVTVTADNLRFCQSGLPFRIAGNEFVHEYKFSLPNMVVCEIYAGEVCINLDIQVQVDPEEFSASVLANIKMWMPNVDKISKRLFPDGRLTIVARGPTIYQNIKISTDLAPWLDSYEFRRVDGKWRQLLR